MKENFDRIMKQDRKGRKKLKGEFILYKRNKDINNIFSYKYVKIKATE